MCIIGAMPLFPEAEYPKSFRKKEALALSRHLAKHQSVVLIGIKRVGIANFIKFFVGRCQNPNQLFIYVDLNDLIELHLSAFWTLVLTRLVDNVQKSGLAEPAKRHSRRLFIQSIQLKDNFFTLEAIRKILAEIGGLSPVVFINHFDRLGKIISAQFLANLTGIRATWVLTGFRPIKKLAHLALEMRFGPANQADARIILNSLEQKYHLSLTQKEEKQLLKLCAGHAQYLHLGVMLLSRGARLNEIHRDEQVLALSEELYASGAREPFNPIFAQYLKDRRKKTAQSGELTNKESRLYHLLKRRQVQLCDRDQIIGAVWPETAEQGITDWAIERLVSRVRSKLKLNRSSEKILTVHTRGYKLVSTS